jgi:hypothetical protein
MLHFATGDPPSPLSPAPFHEWTFPDGTLWTSFFHTHDGYLLRFPGLADFAIDRSGHRIAAWPAQGIHDATVEHLYLNQVLPLAWSKQGKQVLHGSAVEIDAQCVAFVGRAGLGKSTLAASFATSGYRFLSDDGLVLDESEGACLVMPHHPSIRLWDDSQAALLDRAVDMAPSVQYTRKARLMAGPGIAHCDRARPLRRVFFLGDGSACEPVFHAMKPSEALVELARNSFMLDSDERAILSAHFDSLSRLVALPIYFRFDYPRSYAALPLVRRAVVQQLAHEQELA